MWTINKSIFNFIVVPIPAPAVLGVEAFPVVAEDLDGLPLQAESPGEEDIEVDGQAVQVLTVEGFGEAGVVEAILFFRGAPGVAESETKTHQVGIVDQLRDVASKDLLLVA